MGLAGGVRNLPWLFLCTLAAMLVATPLFGVLVTRFPRRQVFIPVLYRFFMLNLLIFCALLNLLPESADVHIGRVFYVWISVFNLFAVSVFWAFMADGFRLRQSKRLFGFIAVGGTLGAIAGSALTANLVEPLGRVTLILLSVCLLEAAVQCVRHLGRLFERRAAGISAEDETTRQNSTETRPAGHDSAQPEGGFLNGILLTLRSPYLLAITGYLFLYTLSSTFLYFEQAHIVADAIAERAARAALFARIDLWVNILTLVTQVVLTGRIIPRLGVGPTLMLLPALTALGFLGLGLAPVLTVLVIFQVLRRAGNYALVKPARETLYTVVSREEKYKAKSFIDTFVYRGGDALGASAFGLLTPIGVGLAGIAFLAIPLALIWCIIGLYLGIKQARLTRGRTAELSPATGTDPG